MKRLSSDQPILAKEVGNDALVKLCSRSINKLDDEAAIDHIAVLIDSSDDLSFARGADRAIYLISELERRNLGDGHAATLEYFRANAWAVKEASSGERGSWAWEHPEREQQILALSRAAVHPGFVKLDPVRRSQILTNRANQLNVMGRIVDAIEGWDTALSVIPRFAMALANRGYGLKHYAGLTDDNRARAILLLHAHDCMVAATSDDAMYDSESRDRLVQQFSDEAKRYALAGDLEQIRKIQDLDVLPFGCSKAEWRYRQWCLDHRLFLNPLNDLGPYPGSACDDLILPPIRESAADRPGAVVPPPIIGFFSQMKQEYVSARFMLYEGLNDTRLHFSDRGVLLSDTLDYPMYSLATERVRTAYRVTYSLLDKVAFLVDHYWRLKKRVDRINFKNVWMVEGTPRLLDCFRDRQNWPLRGLFWLSKELFDEELKRITGPDARELHDIRNALEHKYLQVREGWARPFVRAAPNNNGLGTSIDGDLLEAKALRVMKIARSALIHLSLAIGVEERAQEEPDEVLASMPVWNLDDQRKRRTPA